MAVESQASGNHVDTSDLQSKVMLEIRRVFSTSTAPKIKDEEVERAVSLLFDLLNHGASDDTQGNVGRQVVAELNRQFAGDDLGRAEDRFELFCKFLFRLIDVKGFEALAQGPHGKVQGADILQALGLISEPEIRALKTWEWWEPALPSSIQTVSPFLEHIVRTLKFRNKADTHNAPRLALAERYSALRSFCVFLVWTTMKFSPQIRAALPRSEFSDYLLKVRGDESFASVAKTCVELSARFCSPEEYRISNPLLPLPEMPSGDEEVEVSKLPEADRVTVIEAEEGGGKTTMLRFLAWREAGRFRS